MQLEAIAHIILVEMNDTLGPHTVDANGAVQVTAPRRVNFNAEVGLDSATGVTRQPFAMTGNLLGNMKAVA